MKPNIGLDTKSTEALVNTLNTVLADEHVLYIKIRNFHWNVTGRHFRDIHLLFEEQYTDIADSIDQTAERVKQVGGNAIGSMADFVRYARLKESVGQDLKAEQMLAELLETQETFIRNLREDAIKCGEEFSDPVTEGFLTTLLEKHEKMAWMLRAFLSE